MEESTYITHDAVILREYFKWLVFSLLPLPLSLSRIFFYARLNVERSVYLSVPRAFNFERASFQRDSNRRINYGAISSSRRTNRRTKR